MFGCLAASLVENIDNANKLMSSKRRRSCFASWRSIMAFFAVYSQPTACESSAAPFPVSGGGVDSTSDAGIVGGIPGNINNYPFFAIADLDGGPSCGAVLIHPDILATAAHCFREWRSSSSSGVDCKWVPSRFCAFAITFTVSPYPTG